MVFNQANGFSLICSGGFCLHHIIILEFIEFVVLIALENDTEKNSSATSLSRGRCFSFFLFFFLLTLDNPQTIKNIIFLWLQKVVMCFGSVKSMLPSVIDRSDDCVTRLLKLPKNHYLSPVYHISLFYKPTTSSFHFALLLSFHQPRFQSQQAAVYIQLW